MQVIVLYGNLAVLGLLILQKHSRRPKSTDYSIFRYIQVSYISSQNETMTKALNVFLWQSVYWRLS